MSTQGLIEISLSGGLTRKIVPLDGGFTGGAWLSDDSLVVTHDGFLARVPAGGSALERVALDDPEITIVTSPWPLASSPTSRITWPRNNACRMRSANSAS